MKYLFIAICMLALASCEKDFEEVTQSEIPEPTQKELTVDDFKGHGIMMLTLEEADALEKGETTLKEIVKKKNIEIKKNDLK